MNFNILNKFTTHLRQVLKNASKTAKDSGKLYIQPEDLLASLLKQRGCIGAEILLKSKLRQEHLPSVLPGLASSMEDVRVDAPRLSDHSKRALEKAALVASEYGHKYIGTEHLLYGILEIKNPDIERIFTHHSVNADTVRQHLTIVLRSTSKFPDITKFFAEGAHEGAEHELQPQTAMQNDGIAKGSALEFFCTDLTEPKYQKDVDPIIGRENEIMRMIQILSRRTKNNPVLIGEAGVGKTAIVDGLAKKILEGDVPEILKNKKILSLDLTLVVAGTIYRGEFESRIKQILDEIKENPNIILFIDEVHTLIGAGSTSGSMDAANILKPSLAKGHIRCIGATTLDEYQKHIESDAALERRFQKIIVNEPTPEETLSILQGIRENYETYHRVTITNAALDAAVRLSTRYLQDAFLPDKAIDLIDEAASKARIKMRKDPLTKQIEEIEARLKEVQKKKTRAVAEENFRLAVALKAQEENIRSELRDLHEQQALESRKPLGVIDEKDIADVVSRITKIPLSDIDVEEKERLLRLEDRVAEYIVGQREAVKAVADFIKRSRAGLTNPDRPTGSFLFIGPSGVGKTELAKTIARVVFQDEKALIRFDMSEFAESFQASKLIGAPAGYVGYKEGGKLTESVKRRPYSVVLFDEIEKAHPDIFNLFLQILDDGHLTDATGREVNFKNTIIILTSNIGSTHWKEGHALGFSESRSAEERGHIEQAKEKISKELEQSFRPEFLNRLDTTIMFEPLSRQDVFAIVKLQLNELAKRVSAQEVKLDYSDAVVRHVAEKAYSPEKGAREVRRVIQDKIEGPLADGILAGKFDKGDTVKIGMRKDAMTLTK